jgi:HK97 family phage major capsid protein
VSDSLPIRELERRRLAATNALAAAVRRSTDDPTDRDASVEVELHADAVRNYAEAISAVTDVDPGQYSERSGQSFFRDVVANVLNMDSTAWGRLSSTAYRSTSGGYGALVVPQYLSGRVATSVAGTRPLCDHLTEPLPENGMTLITTRVTTAATAESQDGENTAPTADDPATTEESLAVGAVFGAVSVSWQLANRSDPVGFDRGVVGELSAVVDTLQEARIVAGTGSNGQPTGILTSTLVSTVAVTGTAVADTLLGVAKAINASTTARNIAPDTIVMHPRRWAWMLATAGDYGAAISVNRSDLPVVGQVMGMDVISSPAIPTNLGTSTNEDRIIITRRSDLVMAEEPMRVQAKRDAASQAAQLNAKITAHRMYAFGLITPASTRVIVGAGLANPLA